MKYYVVIDTNVIISGLLEKNNDTNAVKVINLLVMKDIIPLYSESIFQEYKEVLNRKKFGFTKSRIGSFINYIKENGILINPSNIDIELPDSNDIMFYELVMDKTINSNKYLITGNIKHYLKDPIIVTPAEFIEIFEHNK